MLNFYLRRGSKSSYSHLEYFPGGGPPNPNERRRPLLVFCPYGARERLCTSFMHAFGVRIIYFFLVTPLLICIKSLRYDVIHIYIHFDKMYFHQKNIIFLSASPVLNQFPNIVMVGMKRF